MPLCENMELVDKQDGQEILLDEKRKQALLDRFIRELPERQQLALTLCFYEGLSNKEAAEIIGIKLKALQSLIMRAKTTLKERVNNHLVRLIEADVNMTMDPRQFKENILLYGVDLYQWPEEIRQEGLESLQKFPGLQALLAEYEQFERVLKTRKYEEPSNNLVQRIVSLSLHQDKKSPFGLGLFLSRLFADEFYLPKPALIVVSILTIIALLTGFLIGFSNPTGTILTDQRQANLQEFLHYEEGVL